MLRDSARLILGLSLATLVCAPAHAQDGAALDVEEADVVAAEDPGWGLERFAMRFGVFQQDGAGGYQSQASVDRHARGSEQTWIFQPMLYARIRQSQNVHHDVYIPVDVITAASTDARSPSGREATAETYVSSCFTASAMPLLCFSLTRPPWP